MLEGTVSCGAHTIIRRLSRKLCVGFKELLSWWDGAAHPKGFEHLSSHLDHGQAELRRCPRVLDHCNSRLKELLQQLGEVSTILVHEAHEADQAIDHSTRLGLTCQLEDKVCNRCLCLNNFALYGDEENERVNYILVFK